MSTLISSAVSGKKTAPKGAPRRRAAPPAPGAAKQSTPISTSSAQTSVAPPSPPPTQITQNEAPATEPIPTPSLPTSPVQARSQPPQSASPRKPTPVRTPTPIATPAVVHNEVSTTQEDRLPPPPSPPTAKKRTGDQTTAKAPTQPAKRVKRSSTRSNSMVQAQVNDEELPVVLDPALRSAEPTVSASPAPAAPVEKPKRPRKGGRKKKVPPAEGADDGSPQHDLELLDRQIAAARPKPRGRKKRTARAPTESETEADAQQGPEGEQETSESSDDQSDPELHEIDPNTVTMFDVSYNKKYGKTSEREKKMAEIDWREVARKRREENDRIVAAAQPPPTAEDVRQTTEGQDGAAETPSAPAPEGMATVQGVRFRVVNGAIVEDETTLTIDRQAQAQAAVDNNEVIEEENDLTQRINRTMYLHSRRRDPADRVPVWKRKSDPWTEEETDRFYECLSRFGTDFFMISTLFAPKTRRMIKAKFTREERLDPGRVNDALLGRTPHHPNAPPLSLNLESYARDLGRSISDFRKYENAEHAEEVIRESMREKEQEMRDAIREEEEQEVAAREALAEREKGKEKRAARKAAGGGKRGGRKKAVGGLGGGGPVEEVVGGGGGAVGGYHT